MSSYTWGNLSLSGYTVWGAYQTWVTKSSESAQTATLHWKVTLGHASGDYLYYDVYLGYNGYTTYGGHDYSTPHTVGEYTYIEGSMTVNVGSSPGTLRGTIWFTLEDAYGNTTSSSQQAWADEYAGVPLTITYYRNQNSSDTTTESLRYTAGDTNTFDSLWTRTGYTGLGWSTNRSATSASYSAGATISDSFIVSNSPTLTLYQIWKANTYTITYNANGGSGAPSAQTKTHDVTLRLSTTIPTRAGYDFKGWATTVNASSAAYAAGANYTGNGNVTLYAVWSIKTYTVSYNANGGSGAPSSQTKTYNKSLALSTTIPSRTGYTFKGWSTSSSATTAEYAAGGIYSTNAAAVMYAVWQINTYTISYNGNGGSGVPSSQTKTYGVNLTLSSTRPTRTGYSFSGWATSASGTATYAAGGTYSANASATLYAVWTANTYKVTYNANGGAGAPAAGTKTYGQPYTISSTAPTRTGYTFSHWNTLANGLGTTYLAGGTYSQNAELTLYAQWVAAVYTISYSANGGSGAPASQKKTHGTTLILSTVIPSRAGYDFAGWSTTASGAVAYAAGAAYNGESNATLYAVWTAKPTYTLTYKNGTATVTTQSGYSGQTLTVTSETPAKESTTRTVTVTFEKVEEESTISKDSDSCTKTTQYIFSHWNTAEDGSGISYRAGANFQITAASTLYAQFEEYETGSVELPTGTLEQYVLTGWSTNSNSRAVVSSPYSPPNDITLYAVWGPDGNGGLLKFHSPTSTIDGLAVGSTVRLVGLNGGNDGVYTVNEVASSEDLEADDYLITVTFAEDFAESGEQDGKNVQMEIYGPGTYVPNMDFICSKDNRLWGCSSENRTIYASALGDPTDFWTFEGTSLDAYQVAVGSAGAFTGCVTLNSQVLFFKQHTLHKMMGSYPAEYTMYTSEFDGVSEKNGGSLQNCDGVAIYATERGIGTYSGAQSGMLSQELGEVGMTNSIAMYNGYEYFLNFIDSNGNPRSYIYDTRYRIWLQRDFGTVLAFAHLADADYVLKSDEELNAIYRMDSGIPLEGDWQITYKVFLETVTGAYNSKTHVLEKKRYTDLVFRLELPEGSWIQAEVKPDDHPFYPAARATGRKNKVMTFPVRTPRCDRLQLRLTGHGPMTILAMERDYTTGSRR